MIINTMQDINNYNVFLLCKNATELSTSNMVYNFSNVNL